MGDSLGEMASNDSSAATPVLIPSLHNTDSNDAVNNHGSTAMGSTNIRMLEFFSGIGGMRISLEKALELLNNDQGSSSSTGEQVDNQRKRPFVLESCRAYDISLHANNVYHHNFCSDSKNSASGGKENHSVCTKLVEQLKAKDIEPLKANLWTMSPPCQPFTTSGEGRGKQRLDAADKRCNGLKGIAKLLEALEFRSRPRWILLENVKGFCDSAMCEIWCDCLQRNGYSYRSFVLSPVEFGIPNHRTRYYLLAELDSKRWSNEEPNNNGGNDVVDSLSPKSDSINLQVEKAEKRRTPAVHGITSLSAYDEIAKRPIHKVGRYLEDHVPQTEQYPLPENHGNHSQSLLDPYLVPKKVFQKAWSKGLGIVSKHDRATHCFTAGYGRIYHRSTGSLLLMSGSEADVERNGAALEDLPLDRSNMGIYENQLRRFTPEELLKLFGFVNVDAKEGKDNANDGETACGRRNEFEIPSSVVPSLEQRYKLIGNSISVNVVTELLRELLLSA